MNYLVESRPAFTLQRARTTRNHALRAALRGWWARLWMDDMTAYLAQATSHTDLEHRVRRWDERHEAYRWFV